MSQVVAGNQPLLTQGSIKKTLFKLAIPMLISTMGLVMFNLVDTYFVGKLGTLPLAAMAFTYPVVLIVNSFGFGISVGASALISRMIGAGGHSQVQRLTTASLVLTVAIGTVLLIAGQIWLEPVFRLLGADAQTLSLIKDYMRIWFFSLAFFIAPVGDAAIRATGDTIRPSIVMSTSGVLNTILDPIFIFGLGPLPALGIQGAAIATVLARGFTTIVSISILHYNKNMLTLHLGGVKAVLESWKKFLFIGLPSAGTHMIVPVATGIVIRLITAHGTEAVAGFGIASRIEFFLMVAIMALNLVLGPFAGQNIGANLEIRTRKGIKYSQRFALIWGLTAFLVLIIAAEPLASVFNTNPQVVAVTKKYLRIVSLGLGFQGILMLSGTVLNVLNKPIHATLLSLIQMFGLYIPMAFLGEHYFGVTGIFAALAISYILAGSLARLTSKKQLTRYFALAS